MLISFYYETKYFLWTGKRFLFETYKKNIKNKHINIDRYDILLSLNRYSLETLNINVLLNSSVIILDSTYINTNILDNFTVC